MTSASTVTVTVPATTANLGPGFDCLGVALSLYNCFEFSCVESDRSEAAPADLLPASKPATVHSFATSSAALSIEVTGMESDRVATDASNLAYQAFLYLYQQLNQPPPPLRLKIALDVPLARGLGSSATAIVGGLMGANVLAGSPFSEQEIMAMAIAMEGHPDNVVPALIGGCRLAATAKDQRWTICDIVWHAGVVPVIAIPDFELSTAEARRVLPTEYNRADAIFNIAHLGLLLRGLETGNPDWLRSALQDRIHQPYRRALIRGYDAVEAAAIAAGAYGLVISGAGPTLLALTHANRAMAVESAIATAWQAAAVRVEAKVLRLDQRGATLS